MYCQGGGSNSYYCGMGGGGQNTFDIHICIAMKEAGKLVEFLVGGRRVQYCFFYWYVDKLSLDAMNFFLINWRNRYRN